MILVDTDILKALRSGELNIDPFNSDQLGVNSYDVRLDSRLLTYNMGVAHYAQSRDGIQHYLDSRRDNITQTIHIPSSGFILQPGTLYLGNTIEAIDSHDLIPMMDGRSSVGRLGVSIHVTAGFGDLGFCGKWTMEISVIHPVRVYPEMRIAQVWWSRPSSHTNRRYAGKYQNAKGVMASKLFKDE